MCSDRTASDLNMSFPPSRVEQAGLALIVQAGSQNTVRVGQDGDVRAAR